MHLLGAYSTCLYSIGSSAACQQSASRVKCENCETQRKRGEQESSRGHKFSILENVVPFRDCTSATLPRFEVFLLGRACPRPCWKRVQQTGTCRGKAPPSCYARPFCRLKAPLGLSLFCFAPQTRIVYFFVLGAISNMTVTRIYKPYSNQVMVLFQGKLISGWFNANTINATAIISITKPTILDVLFFM